MNTIIKYFAAATFALFIGAEMNAQEKNKKKKQDSAYLQNKARADEQRNREAEEKRRNDSIRVARHNDSLALIRRSDSIKYDRTRRDSLHNVEMQRRQDSIDKSQPPKKGSKDKKAPPKNEGNKEE
jgi:hypothetical protein